MKPEVRVEDVVPELKFYDGGWVGAGLSTLSSGLDLRIIKNLKFVLHLGYLSTTIIAHKSN